MLCSFQNTVLVRTTMLLVAALACRGDKESQPIAESHAGDQVEAPTQAPSPSTVLNPNSGPQHGESHERIPATQVSAEGQALPKLRVRLVDTIWWHGLDYDDLDSGILHHVELVSRLGIDTIPQVLTSQLPQILPDSGSVVGFLYGTTYHGVGDPYFYSVFDSTLVTRTLPPAPGGDYQPWASQPRFSPDGRHLAYVGNDKNYHFWAVIRSWPDIRVVATSARVRMECTDYSRNRVGWIGSDSVEIHMDTCVGSLWARARGSVLAGQLLLDSVRSLPTAPSVRN